MSKKVYFLISFVLVLSLANVALAQDPDYLDMWGEYLFDSPDPNADTSIHDNNIISLGADATVGVAEGYNGTAYQGTPNEVGGDYSYALLPVEVLPVGGGDFTIEMMVNFDVLIEGEASGDELSSMEAISTEHYYFQLESGWRDGNFSEPNFYMSSNLWWDASITPEPGSWVGCIADSVGPIATGQWYHWVFSLDTTNRIMRHWFDGELVGYQQHLAGTNFGTFGDDVYLGCEGYWAFPFQGRIDEVRFYRGYTEYYFPPGGPDAPTAYATRPIPKVLTENVAREDLTLRWKAGGWVADVNGHEVYFGTDANSVEDANRFNQALYPGVYRGPNDVNIWLDPEDPNIIRYTYDVPETLDLGTTYYWRVDEVNEDYVPGPNDPNIPPDYRWKGSVWNFEVEGKAYDPYPADEATDVYYGVVLSWTAGAEANLHDVYFDSNEAAVEDANTASDPNIYRGSGNVGVDPCDPNRYTYEPEILDLLTTYYWRIDEVNTVVVKGDIWSFVTGDHFVVDDFEPYADVTALRAVWKDWYADPRTQNKNDAQVFLETDETYVYGGDQSMRFAYRCYKKSGPDYVGSEAEASIANLEKSGPDWTLSGSKALVLYFYGDAGNGTDHVYPITVDQMYVALEDGDDGSVGIVKYDKEHNYDMNDIKEEEWHEWNIDLADPCLADVNMANVAKVYIGFGGVDKTGQSEGGAGMDTLGSDTVWFDDIGVYPTRCRPELSYPYGDLDGDCNVGVYDLEGMLDDWLEIDYEVLSVPPNDANLLVRYTFDIDLSDSSGNAYHGIAINDVNVHDGMLTLLNEYTWPTYDQVNPILWTYPADMNAVEIPFPNQVDVWNNSYTVFIEARTHQDNTGLAYENVWPIMYLGVTDPAGAWCRSEITFYQAFDVLRTEMALEDTWAASADHACQGGSTEYGTVADANWHKIVWTYDAGSDWHYCYVDVYGDGGFDIWGESGEASSFGNDLDPCRPWKTLIGATWSGSTAQGAPAVLTGVIIDEGTSFMTGDINEIRIYDYAVPLGELLNLMGYEGIVYMPLDSRANYVPKDPCDSADPNLGSGVFDPNNVDIINFRDYVVMANNWLEGPFLWP